MTSLTTWTPRVGDRVRVRVPPDGPCGGQQTRNAGRVGVVVEADSIWPRIRFDRGVPQTALLDVLEIAPVTNEEATR